MTKKNSLLTVLLIVQLAVLAFIYRPGAQQEPSKTSFFSELAIEQVQGLTITDDEQKSITLKLNDGKWWIQNGSFPANAESIKKLLDKIKALQSARLVSTTQSSQVRLKVGDDLFNRKIDLQLEGGTIKSFFLGTAPSSKTIHFRLAGQNEVYMVNDLAIWELQTDNESWWQTTYVSVAVDDLNSISISNAKGTFTVQKGEENKWLIPAKDEGMEESQDKLRSFAGSLAKLSIDTYLDTKTPDNIGEPICTVEYDAKPGPFSLTIWPTAEENGSHPAKASNADFYVTIRAYMLKELLEAEAANFLAAATSSTENASQGTEPEPPAAK